MKVLLVTVVTALLAAPLLAAPPKGSVDASPRRLVPVNPTYTSDQWDELLASQTLGQEVCAGCAPGTEPQHPLAGKVATGNGLRVINGKYAADNQFPWMVSIKMDNTWRCGGSLISDTFVLTSALCSSGYNTFSLILGDTGLLWASSTRHVAATYKSFVHEDFAEDTIDNNIGLLQLLVPVPISDAIRPVKLPSTADVAKTFEGVNGIVSGWGETIYGYPAYDLMYVEQPIMSNKRCARFFGSFVHTDVICGDGEGQVGACGSDAGDPLIVKGDADDEWKQVGIFSFGSSIGCTWGYPSAYVRVTEHLLWIQDKTGIKL